MGQRCYEAMLTPIGAATSKPEKLLTLPHPEPMRWPTRSSCTKGHQVAESRGGFCSTGVWLDPRGLLGPLMRGISESERGKKLGSAMAQPSQ
jgi:hypothetical protein